MTTGVRRKGEFRLVQSFLNGVLFIVYLVEESAT